MKMLSRLFQQPPEEFSSGYFHTLRCTGRGFLQPGSVLGYADVLELSALLINMQGATAALEFVPFTTSPCRPLQVWHSLRVPGGCAGLCLCRL